MRQPPSHTEILGLYQLHRLCLFLGQTVYMKCHKRSHLFLLFYNYSFSLSLALSHLRMPQLRTVAQRLLNRNKAALISCSVGAILGCRLIPMSRPQQDTNRPHPPPIYLCHLIFASIDQSTDTAFTLDFRLCHTGMNLGVVCLKVHLNKMFPVELWCIVHIPIWLFYA